MVILLTSLRLFMIFHSSRFVLIIIFCRGSRLLPQFDTKSQKLSIAWFLSLTIQQLVLFSRTYLLLVSLSKRSSVTRSFQHNSWNFFSFNEETFKQVSRMAMGTQVAPTYANFVTAYMESRYSSVQDELFGDNPKLSIYKLESLPRW